MTDEPTIHPARIRRAEAGDAETLALLNRTIHDLHLEARPDRFKNPEPQSIVDWFGSLLGQANVSIWLAECDGRSAGYVVAIDYERAANHVCLARRFCEIDHLAVTAEFRRRGVARALVSAVVDWAKARSIARIELSAWAFNGDALETYRALGFSPQSIRFELDV